jgi:hypothetical protein
VMGSETRMAKSYWYAQGAGARPHGRPINCLWKSLIGPKPVAVILVLEHWVSLRAAA